jgi:hypothetical protein
VITDFQCQHLRLGSRLQLEEHWTELMTEQIKPPKSRWLHFLGIIWSSTVMLTACAVGAYIGFQSHGLGGAIGGGAAGLILGMLLSDPLILLQLLT